MTLLSFGSYALTRAFFSDTAVSGANTFTAAASFGEETTQPTSEKVVINEIKAEGGDSSEWIEIYNASNGQVNVAGWKITDNNATVTIPGDEVFLPAETYAVIVASTSGVTIPSPASKITLSGQIGNGLNPSSDRVILKDETDLIIDRVSWGEDTSIFTIPSLTAGQTLQRIPDHHDTDTAQDWQRLSPRLGIAN